MRGYIRNSGDDLDKLMALMRDAIAAGDDAQITMLQAQIDQVRAMAMQAEETGQNARNMVRTRDPRLETLEGVAATVQAALAHGDAEHARLDQRIDAEDERARAALATEAQTRQVRDEASQAQLDALRSDLANIELTPGPQGPPGKDGVGRDGRDGQPGAPGLNGLSAYQIARTQGYGGTETQWLATLKGDTGAAGKDFDPAVAAALTARIVSLEGAVTALRSPKPFAVGIAATPAIALLQSTDITIELSREMPDTDYTLELSRSQGLLTAGAVTYKSRTKTTVTYTLRAVVALGAGSLVVLARY